MNEKTPELLLEKLASGPGAIARKIDHVAVAVNDADTTARWYEHSLGMVKINDEEIHQGLNVRLVFLSTSEGPEGTTLQLVSPIGDGPVARFLEEQGEGLHHVCFSVDNLPHSLAALGDPAAAVFTGGYGLPCAFVHSDVPANVRIELVEHAPAG
jgi:methylmalonyl-CoA/ethylmalonyl-CoA epimerase